MIVLFIPLICDITILILFMDCKGIFHKKVAYNDIKFHYFDTFSFPDEKRCKNAGNVLCIFPA